MRCCGAHRDIHDGNICRRMVSDSDNTSADSHGDSHRGSQGDSDTGSDGASGNDRTMTLRRCGGHSE